MMLEEIRGPGSCGQRDRALGPRAGTSLSAPIRLDSRVLRSNGPIGSRARVSVRRLAYSLRMTGIPSDWNVVVVGSWNLAIFTPSWIAETLYQVGPDTPVNVQVAFDRAAPMQVTYQDLTVAPGDSRLAIVPHRPEASAIARAADVAARALEALPVTPVRAAGVNFRYLFPRVPEELQAVLRTSLDDELAELDHKVRGRGLRRALGWNGGVLNVAVDEDEQLAARVGLNFDRQSADRSQLREWLGQCSEMAAETEKILKDVLKITTEGNGDEPQQD